MQGYSFYIFRYVPDEAREEFLNIGIALFCAERTYLLFSNDFDRLLKIHPQTNTKLISEFIEEIRNNRIIKSSEILNNLPKNIRISDRKDGNTDLPINNVFYELFSSLVKSPRA